MSGMKEAFDNYMDMILSSGGNDSSQSIDDLSDFNDIDIDEELGMYRDIFTSKEDSFEADEMAKCSWRDNYDYDFDYDIDPEEYETEEEYLDALEEARLDMDKNENISEQEYSENISLGKQSKTDIDSFKLCMLLVHHTRKQPAGDKFEMISGTNGLLGCADGAFLLHKEKRTDTNAILGIVGRDQADQTLYLKRDPQRLIWNYDRSETERRAKIIDPLLVKIDGFVTEANPQWTGSAAELTALLGEEIQPNILTRKLNVLVSELLNEYGIEYKAERNRNGCCISLTRLRQ